MNTLENKTLGILSSWTENCGNASYTRQLIEELKPFFKNVECIHLNQGLIQAGVNCDDDIIAQVKSYDYINLQYEPALFGRTTKSSNSLVKKIINAHNNISITIHSGMIHNNVKLKKSFPELRLNLDKFLRRIRVRKRNKFLHSAHNFAQLLLFLRKAKRAGKNIKLIVHRKEISDYISRFDLPVEHHPIVAATNLDIIKYNSPQSRENLLLKYNLDKSKKYLGIFGFTSAYKGFDVVLDALELLPDEYNLVMCCQRHPISSKNMYNPAQEDILKYPDEFYKRTFCADKETILLNHIIKTKNLYDRVHYINHLIDEEDFKEVISAVDYPVFAYYEVGQGGSGPISYATLLNHNAKIMASRTKAFEEYAQDYYPNCFNFFDQGNSVELSKKVLNARSKKTQLLEAISKYGVDSNIQVYLRSLMS